MGYSSPNPPVACVITNLDGKILAQGHTQKVGENHAEREAYQKFTLEYSETIVPHLVFVTLEPCTHFGKTPPCLDLLIKYKPNCVYFGLPDPNPLVKTRNGFQESKNAGIEIVHSPEIEKISRSFLSGFISRIEKKTPQIFIKSALSKEGFYSSLDKEKIAISNSISNEVSQMLRAKVDAVIVGPKTVQSDLPGLNFRKLDNLIHSKFEENKNPIQKKSDHLFSQSLFDYSTNSESKKLHNLKFKEYQPYRIFIVSGKNIPSNSFFEKQSLLNENLESKKTIFFLLDFEKGNELHQKIITNLIEISSHSLIFIQKEESVLDKIIKLCNDLSLNTLLVEGGNFLYQMFSENLGENDLVFLIRTDTIIKKGISPQINLEGQKKIFEIQLEKDIWEVYRS